MVKCGCLSKAIEKQFPNQETNNCCQFGSNVDMEVMVDY